MVGQCILLLHFFRTYTNTNKITNTNTNANTNINTKAATNTNTTIVACKCVLMTSSTWRKNVSWDLFGSALNLFICVNAAFKYVQCKEIFLVKEWVFGLVGCPTDVKVTYQK